MERGMRFGFVELLMGSEMTVDVLTIVIVGCGITTVKLPTPRSMTVPSVPSLAVTRTVQPPSDGDAGTVYGYWKTQVAAACELQVAGAPCAVIATLFTCVTFDGSMIVTRAPPMSKLPNGSLTCAR